MRTGRFGRRIFRSRSYMSVRVSATALVLVLVDDLLRLLLAVVVVIVVGDDGGEGEAAEQQGGDGDPDADAQGQPDAAGSVPGGAPGQRRLRTGRRSRSAGPRGEAR